MQYQDGLNFDEPEFRNSRRMAGGGGAAGLASTAAALKAMNAQSADWGTMAKTNIAADGLIQRTMDTARAAEEIGRIENEAYLEIAKDRAKAEKDASNKSKSSNMWGNIIKTGATLAFSALSDERAKNTIEGIEDALSTLRKLRPVTFYYNEEYSCNPERQHRGFIAQEYKEVLPSATYHDETTDMLCIDTHELIALLVRGVQQLEDKVARLEASNALAGVK